MKHTKPTMSWAMDQNHLNELLVKYWEREYKELLDEVKKLKDHISPCGYAEGGYELAVDINNILDHEQ